MKQTQVTTQKGFTIVESLVAISILVTVIVGATTAVQTGLSSYISSQDQIVAFYLAQEGFEQIRNIRDENHLKNNSWLTGIALSSSDPCYFGQACTVSPVESAIPTRCSAVDACPLLRQNASTGFFGYDSSWPLTKFRRQITLTTINATEIAVTVKVTWSKGNAFMEFKARENLLNWQ